MARWQPVSAGSGAGRQAGLLAGHLPGAAVGALVHDPEKLLSLSLRKHMQK